MRARLMVIGGVAAAIVLGGCSGMSTTEQRTLSGAAIGTAGGAVVSAITGEWGWAVAGAAIGAASGYIYDKEKDKQQAAQQAAYDKGVAAGKQQAADQTKEQTKPQ